MSEQKSIVSSCVAPTASEPLVGSNVNLGANGVVGCRSRHAAGMSPLFVTTSS